MNTKNAMILISLMIGISGQGGAKGETTEKPTKPAETQPAEAGETETDARLMFLTAQLASVESSITAVDKALRRAGYKQIEKKEEADRYRGGNELMDRKGGGPVHWEEFYGRTADKFAYKSRPTQFDNIYRANAERQQQATNEADALGDKVQTLLARRRQLEDEQSAIWAKVAFRVVARRDLASKSLYRFDLDTEGADADYLEAARSGCNFVRTAVGEAEQLVEFLDVNQRAVYAQLHQSTKAARADLDTRLLQLQALALDVENPKTTVGKLSAAAKRLDDVSRNIDDAYRLAGEGDQDNDDQRKNTFRGQLQEMLIEYADALLMMDRNVSELTRKWGLRPNPKVLIVTPRPRTIEIAPQQSLPDKASPAPKASKGQGEAPASAQDEMQPDNTPAKQSAPSKEQERGTRRTAANKPVASSIAPEGSHGGFGGLKINTSYKFADKILTFDGPMATGTIAVSPIAYKTFDVAVDVMTVGAWQHAGIRLGVVEEPFDGVGIGRNAVLIRLFQGGGDSDKTYTLSVVDNENVVASARLDKGPNEWVRLRVIADGETTRVWVDNKPVVQAPVKARSGPFALYVGGGASARFRNLVYR